MGEVVLFDGCEGCFYFLIAASVYRNSPTSVYNAARSLFLNVKKVFLNVVQGAWQLALALMRRY